MMMLVVMFTVMFIVMLIVPQMEMYQAGYYSEDFRTQEVPVGFDFSSYGNEHFRNFHLHVIFFF